MPVRSTLVSEALNFSEKLGFKGLSVEEVLIFENRDKKYYHVFLNDESNSEYDASEDYPVLNYLREAATVPSLLGNDPDSDADESPAKLLPLQYSKLGQVNSNSALCSYLTGYINNKTQKLDHVLFPFGRTRNLIYFMEVFPYDLRLQLGDFLFHM